MTIYTKMLNEMHTIQKYLEQLKVDKLYSYNNWLISNIIAVSETNIPNTPDLTSSDITEFERVADRLANFKQHATRNNILTPKTLRSGALAGYKNVDQIMISLATRGYILHSGVYKNKSIVTFLNKITLYTLEIATHEMTDQLIINDRIQLPIIWQGYSDE